MRTVGMGAIPKDAALTQEIADLKAENAALTQVIEDLKAKKATKKTKAEDQDPAEE